MSRISPTLTGIISESSWNSGSGRNLFGAQRSEIRGAVSKLFINTAQDTPDVGVIQDLVWCVRLKIWTPQPYSEYPRDKFLETGTSAIEFGTIKCGSTGSRYDHTKWYRASLSSGVSGRLLRFIWTTVENYARSDWRETAFGICDSDYYELHEVCGTWLSYYEPQCKALVQSASLSHLFGNQLVEFDIVQEKPQETIEVQQHKKY